MATSVRILLPDTGKRRDRDVAVVLEVMREAAATPTGVVATAAVTADYFELLFNDPVFSGQIRSQGMPGG